MSTGWPASEITDIFAALEEARVVDFVRYVARQMRERPEMESLPFKTGWNIMLGGYGELAATPFNPPEAA